MFSSNQIANNLSSHHAVRSAVAAVSRRKENPLDARIKAFQRRVIHE